MSAGFTATSVTSGGGTVELLSRLYCKSVLFNLHAKEKSYTGSVCIDWIFLSRHFLALSLVLDLARKSFNISHPMAMGVVRNAR